MPYSVPTPPPTSLTSSPPLPTHSMGHPGHRRSYSQFSDERGPGTFTSLGALPRRKTPPTSATAKRFHFGRKTNDDEDDTSESSSDDDDAKRVYAGNGVPPLKLKIQQNTFGGIPFPQSSPMHSPVNELLSPLSGLPPTLASSPAPTSTANPKFLVPPVRPSPSRTSSSPILLSNGKPLKSSLKSSSSTSSIPSQNPDHHHNNNNTTTSFHTRARSAPSTPGDLLSSSPSPSSPAPGSPSGSGSQPNPAYGTSVDGFPYDPLSPTSSTVSTPKNVHFPSLPTDLEHVRVFNRSARPASLLLPRTSSSQLGGRGDGEGEGTGAEETETETERDTENEREKERESFAAALNFGGYGRGGNRFNGSRGAHLQPPRAPRWSTGMVPPSTNPQAGNSYPFPNKMQLPIVKPKTKEEGRYELDLGTQPIPHPGSRNPYVNVALESLSLARDGKVALEGTLLVRNLAFEKHVFLRFTMDEWATVSEVRASYVESLTYGSTMDKGEKGLGKQVPSWLRRGVTVGDVVASVSSGSSEDVGNDQFDRFAFSINLSDYAHARTLHTRTTQLVARFSCHPNGQGEGEWWDNASGGNYKVGYRWVTKNEEEEKEIAAPPQSTIQLQRPSPSSASPAPPTLSPITTTFSTSSSATISNNATSDSISASPTSPTGLVKASVRAPDPTHQSALSAATSARLRRFSLSNYVAPGSATKTTSTASQVQQPSQPQSPPEADSVSTVAFPSVEDKEQKKDEQKPSSGLGLGTLGLYWPWGSSSSSSEDKQVEEPRSQQLPASATVEVLSPSPIVNSNGPFGSHNRDSSNSSIASTASTTSTASTASTEVPALVRSSTSGNTSSSSNSSVSNSSESLDSWFEAHRYVDDHGHGMGYPTFGSLGNVSVSSMDMGMGIGMSGGEHEHEHGHGHARGYHIEGFDFDHTRHVHDEDEDKDARREDVKTPTPDSKFVMGVLGEESSSLSSSGSNSVSGSGVGSSPTEETPAVSLEGKTPTARYFDPRAGSRSRSSSAGSGSETEMGGTTPPINNESRTTTTGTTMAPKPTLNLEGLKHLRHLSDPSRLSPYSLSSPRAASPRLGHVLGSGSGSGSGSPKVSPRISPRVSPGANPMSGSPRVLFIGPSNPNPATATATVAENPERLLSPRPNPAEVNSDSLYQAFVKQWCFAGSSPSSSMGMGMGTDTSASVSPELGGGFEVGA